MYRIMCNSLKNYSSAFSNDTSDIRYSQVLFLRLIEDIDNYMDHKERNSELYRKLSQFLYSISNCDRCSNILHELSMLGVEPEDCGDPTDFAEAHAVWHMMLKLGYWKD
jgi:hypothetical protein